MNMSAEDGKEEYQTINISMNTTQGRGAVATTQILSYVVCGFPLLTTLGQSNVL